MPVKVILTAIAGPLSGQVFELAGPGSYVMGRARDADFRLPEEDLFVSRRHVRLEIVPPRCRVRDLGTTGYRSTNSPLINGRPMDLEAEIRDGDVLGLGLSEFSIGLSLLEEEDPRATLPRRLRRRDWAPGTTVLYVEDDPLTARLIHAALEREGLRALAASNGGDGLALLKRHRVDLVSTDLMMPNMDGFWLIREIRELPDSPLNQVPILVLTENGSEEDILRCLACGADNYLVKPFSPQAYLDMLWRFHRNIRD